MPPDLPAAELERYRAELHLLARLHLGGRRHVTVDASDVVQQALLQAHQARAQFRGTTEPELLAWLRRILANALAHAERDRFAQKRDPRREQSLEAALDASSARLEAWLAADQSSPSQRADRNEQMRRLAAALATLPEAQGEALVLHYWQDQTVTEIAAALGKTPAAVAGLLKRGLRTLREQLNPGSQS